MKFILILMPVATFLVGYYLGLFVKKIKIKAQLRKKESPEDLFNYYIR